MKFDNIITEVYDTAKGDEENREVAYAILEEKFKKPLMEYKFPPHAYVQFECMLCLEQMIWDLYRIFSH